MELESEDTARVSLVSLVLVQLCIVISISFFSLMMFLLFFLLMKK